MTETASSAVKPLIDLGPLRFTGSGTTWHKGAKYHTLHLVAGDSNDILILSSSTGAAVHVFVNGEELKKTHD